MRNKTHLPHTLFLPRLYFTPSSSYSQCRRMRNGGCNQTITPSLLLLPLHTLPLLQREVPSMGYSPSRSVPVCTSSGLQFKNSSSMGCSPVGTDCSSVGPPQAAVPTRQPAPQWALLHGLQLPLQHTDPWCRVLHRLQCEYLFWGGPPWAASRQFAPPRSS